MDFDLKEMIERLKIEAYRNKKIREKYEKNKCEYCRNGIVEVKGEGFNLAWECQDYLKENCPLRKEYIEHNFGSVFKNISKEELPEPLRNIYDSYDFRKNIIAIGSVGIGKTSFLILLFLKAKVMKKQVSLVTARRLMKSFDFDRESPYKHRKILLIDDLGTEFRTDFTTSEFQDLIDYRWRHSLPTVITSNLSLEKLFDLYPRAIDRLRMNAHVVSVLGESRR